MLSWFTLAIGSGSQILLKNNDTYNNQIQHLVMGKQYKTA